MIGKLLALLLVEFVVLQLLLKVLERVRGSLEIAIGEAVLQFVVRVFARVARGRGSLLRRLRGIEIVLRLARPILDVGQIGHQVLPLFLGHFGKVAPAIFETLSEVAQVVHDTVGFFVADFLSGPRKRLTRIGQHLRQLGEARHARGPVRIDRIVAEESVAERREDHEQCDHGRNADARGAVPRHAKRRDFADGAP